MVEIMHVYANIQVYHYTVTLIIMIGINFVMTTKNVVYLYNLRIRISSFSYIPFMIIGLPPPGVLSSTVTPRRLHLATT